MLLLTAAHGLGQVFARLRQPPVIGEILGGLMLGPTVLGALAPDLQAAIFPVDGPSAVVLGAIYQLGLLLLMYCSGMQMRGLVDRRALRTVGIVSVVGMTLPFAAGLGALLLIDTSPHEGSTGAGAPFTLVFCLAIAVTSIPVISRIMFDLGILQTRFARIVLAVAVIEDMAVYVVLAVALGLAQARGGSTFGLPSALGLDRGSFADAAYHALATAGFLAVVLAAGPTAYRWCLRSRLNLLERRSPVAFELSAMFALSGAALALGIVPLFGAFVAGIAAAAARGDSAVRARASISGFSFAFFIPVYFAMVGLKLDLLQHFSPAFFAGFLAFACAAKSASVYLGARMAGETAPSARNLAVAMNARGGPGIVLASVALDAGIVSDSFYVTLVMLAVLTSLLAGSWLSRVVRAAPATEPLPSGSAAHAASTS